MKKIPLFLLTGWFVLTLLAGCILVPSGPSLSDMERKDFTLPLLEGGTVQLSSYLGRPVILCFFTPQCPHCRTEAPLLEAAYQRHSSEGLVVLGVGYIGGSSEETLRDFVLETGITYPVAIDTSTTRVTLDLYGVRSVPHNVFFDRSGNIVRERTGEPSESELEQYIQEIL